MDDNVLDVYEGLEGSLLHDADGNTIGGEHGPLDLLLDAIAGPDHSIHNSASISDHHDHHEHGVYGDHDVDHDMEMQSEMRELDEVGQEYQELVEGMDDDHGTAENMNGSHMDTAQEIGQTHIDQLDIDIQQSAINDLEGLDPDLDQAIEPDPEPEPGVDIEIIPVPHSIEGLLEASKLMDGSIPIGTSEAGSGTAVGLNVDPTISEVIASGEEQIGGLTLEALTGLFGGEGEEDELTPAPSPIPSEETKSAKPKRKHARTVKSKEAGSTRVTKGKKKDILTDPSSSIGPGAALANGENGTTAAGRKRKRQARSTSPVDGEAGEDTPGAGPGPSTVRRRRNKASTTASTAKPKPTLSTSSTATTAIDPRAGILGGHDPKISRMFAATRGPNGSRIPEQSMSFSSITLLHGNVAQKTYGKEKRFLNPPPVVRMAGSVSDTVESISLQIINKEHLEAGEGIPMVSNNQGVDFSVPDREVEARQYLREGLYFSGLFAASTGKAKTFHLKLNVYQPGGTDSRPDEGERENDRVELLELDESIGQDGGRNVGRISVEDDGPVQASKSDQDGRESEEPDPAMLATLAAQTMASSIEGIQQLQRSVDSGEDEASQRAEILGEGSGALTLGEVMEPTLMGQDDNVQDAGAKENLRSAAPDPDDIAEGQIEDSLLKDDGNISGGELLEPASGENAAPLGGNTIIRDIAPDAANNARPWAEFESEAVTIISKPSKKTSKTKHIEGGLTVDTPISLWSRINQQAVRTKYMYVDNGKLLGRPCDWSAFAVDVVRRGVPGPDVVKKITLPPTVLTYGSTVILRDIHSGYRTEPLLLCKVLQGKLELDDFGPVIDMQRVAFAKVVRGQGRWYLRAPGNDRPVRDDETGKPVTRTRRRIKEKDSLNSSVIKKDAPEFDLEVLMEEGQQVVYAAPKVQLEMVDGVMQETEYIDDFISWTVASISEHNYTFFEGRHEVGDFTSVFKTALTPIPASIDTPVYRSGHNTLTMTVTNFLYDDDNPTFRNKPLLIYLGAIGPLAYRSYRSTALRVPPPGIKGKGIDPENHYYPFPRYPALPIDGGEEFQPEDRPYSAIPQDIPHVILVIHLPSPADIWDATRIERERAEAAEQARIAKEAESGRTDQDEMDDDWTKYEEPDIPFAGRSLVDLPPRKIREAPPEEQTEEANDAQLEILAEQDEPVQKADEAVANVDALPVLPEGNTLAAASEAHHSASPVTETPAVLEQQSIVQEHQMQHDDYGTHDDYDHVDAASLDPTTGLRVDQAGPDAHPSIEEHAYDADMLANFDGSVPPHVREMFTVAALERAASNADMLASASMLDPDTRDLTPRRHHMQLQLQQDQARDRLLHNTLSDNDLAAVHEDRYLQYGEPEDIFDTFDRHSAQDKTLGRQIAPKRKRKGPGGEKLPKLPRVPKPPKERSTPKPRPPVVKPTLGPSALGDLDAPSLKLTRKPFEGPVAHKNLHRDNNPMNLENLGGNSSLPLLFVRASDGTGYHTGKNVVIERGYLGEEWLIRVPE